MVNIKKNSYIKVEKTIQTHRIGVIIGKRKSNVHTFI